MNYREPDSQLRPEIFRRICGVYAWRRGSSNILYVGVSVHLMLRLIGHTVINVAEPMLPDDVIDVWEYPDGTDKLVMEQYERALINHWKPKYNIAYNPSGVQEPTRRPHRQHTGEPLIGAPKGTRVPEPARAE